MDGSTPAQAWIGHRQELAPTWAERWRATSRLPWGVAWVHLVQAVAAADEGDVGLAARAEASGLLLVEARVVEADWSAAFGVVWREDAPPTWDPDSGLDALLVPTHPATWSRLRAHWRATVGRARFTGPWAVVQWALQALPAQQAVGRTIDTATLATRIGASRNSTVRWKAQALAAGLLIEERLTGRASKLRWPPGFEQGYLPTSDGPGHQDSSLPPPAPPPVAPSAPWSATPVVPAASSFAPSPVESITLALKELNEQVAKTGVGMTVSCLYFAITCNPPERLPSAE